MAANLVDAIRERVYGYLRNAGAGLPHADGEPLHVTWLVSGTELDGLRASFSDADDVIEFGLLSRSEGVPLNELNVSIVLDDEVARLLCTSETRDDLNFESSVSPEQAADGLYLACHHFAQLVGASVPI